MSTQNVESGPAAKGVVVASVVAMLKKWRRDNPAQPLPQLTAADLAFLDQQRVLATEYYDLGLYHRVIQTVCDAMLGGGRQAARSMGAGAARIALEGVYQVFVQPGDPARTLDAVPRMWTAHYRGSSAEVERVDGGARITVRGYGAMPEVMQQINAAWMETCVALAGAQGIRSSHRDTAEGFVVELQWD